MSINELCTAFEKNVFITPKDSHVTSVEDLATEFQKKLTIIHVVDEEVLCATFEEKLQIANASVHPTKDSPTDSIDTTSIEELTADFQNKLMITHKVDEDELCAIFDKKLSVTCPAVAASIEEVTACLAKMHITNPMGMMTPMKPKPTKRRQESIEYTDCDNIAESPKKRGRRSIYHRR